MDCSTLSDDNFSLDDVKDKTGDWMRVGAFVDWVNERIFEETLPGRKMFQCSFLIMRKAKVKFSRFYLILYYS